MAREQFLQFTPFYLVYGVGTSFVMTIAFFKLIGPALSTLLTSKYKFLPKSTQADWNGRVTSNVNAVVCIALSGYALFFEEGIRDELIWHDSPYARWSCSIIMGYAIGDIMTMLLWCRVKRAEFLGYFFHHAAAVYAYYYVSAYGIFCYIAMLRLIAEMSTPPVNQRWFFDVLNTPRGNLMVVINGLLMVLTFFIFRICTMPLYWYEIWLFTGTEAVVKLGAIQLTMYLPCIVLDTLNMYWFYKICRGFSKAVRSLKNSETNLKFKSI